MSMGESLVLTNTSSDLATTDIFADTDYTRRTLIWSQMVAPGKRAYPVGDVRRAMAARFRRKRGKRAETESGAGQW